MRQPVRATPSARSNPGGTTTQGTTVTSFIEEALREALRRHLERSAQPQYVVEPFRGGVVLPGVDLDDNAALAELVDADDRP